MDSTLLQSYPKNNPLNNSLPLETGWPQLMKTLKKIQRKPFPLYHWSPVERRKQILRFGLKPHSKSRCGQWKPPYVCFSDSPSLAWGLSACFSDGPGEWDLWMMWSNSPTGYETLTTGHNPSGKPTEYRVYERVPKSKLWHVGVRTYKLRASA